jgi:hypothetical protein
MDMESKNRRANVKPARYNKTIDGDTGSAKESATGFSPQLAGHGKHGRSHTSSFGGPPDYTIPGYPSSLDVSKKDVGLEEGGRRRQPTTSVAGRIHEKNENR